MVDGHVVHASLIPRMLRQGERVLRRAPLRPRIGGEGSGICAGKARSVALFGLGCSIFWSKTDAAREIEIFMILPTYAR